MTACAFCEIAAGTRPAAIVLQTEWVTGFLDHAPLFPGHTLLIPRSHAATVEDVTADAGEAFWGALTRVARAVRLGTGSQGTFVAMNNVVSQSVPHLHAHIVPRTRGDGLRGFFWPRTRYEDDAHREAVRAAIATFL